MLVGYRELRVCAKVDSHATTEDHLAIQRLFDELRRGDIVENNDDAVK